MPRQPTSAMHNDSLSFPPVITIAVMLVLGLTLAPGFSLAKNSRPKCRWTELSTCASALSWQNDNSSSWRRSRFSLFDR